MAGSLQLASIHAHLVRHSYRPKPRPGAPTLMADKSMGNTSTAIGWGGTCKPPRAKEGHEHVPYLYRPCKSSVLSSHSTRRDYLLDAKERPAREKSSHDKYPPCHKRSMAGNIQSTSALHQQSFGTPPLAPHRVIAKRPGSTIVGSARNPSLPLPPLHSSNS